MSKDAPSKDKAAPTKHRHGWFWWSLIVIGVCVMALGGLVYSQADRPIKVPQWVHDRVEARLSAALPDAHIRFGDLSVIIPTGKRPRILLRDAEITNEDGRPILSLANLEAKVAFKPLLRGEVKLGGLVFSGATVNVRRRADGFFDLSFGSLPEAQEAASVAELIAKLDGLLLTPELAALARVEAEALTLRYEDARADRAWTIDGVRFDMTRADTDLRLRADMALLGGYDYATTVELNYESQIGELAASFGMNFEDMAARDIAGQVGALAWLEAVRAPISGALRLGMTPEGQLGQLSGTLQIAEGVLQPSDQARPIPFQQARTYFTFDPSSQTLAFDELSIQSPQFSGNADGRALLVGLEDGRLQQLQGQFTIAHAMANPNRMYPEPVSLDGAEMTFRLDLDPFEFTLGEMSLSKDSNVLVVSGKMRADDLGWNLSLNGRVSELSDDTVLTFWPESLKPKTRRWVSENIHKVTLKNAQLALRAQQGKKPTVFLASEFQDGEIRFMKHMPPIVGAAGRAELVGARFVVTAEKGVVMAPLGGAVDITGTSLIVDDVRIKPAPAQVRLKTSGTITGALSLLDRPPLEVMTKAGRPVTIADGRVETEGQIFLRLQKKLPKSEVRYSISADLKNVRSTKLIPNRVFAAPSLKAKVSNEKIVISGSARVGQVPVEGHWVSPIEGNPRKISRVEASLTLSNSFLDEFNIALPAETVSGAGPAAMVLDMEQGKPPRYNLSSSLKGIGLRIPELGWSLAKQETGALSVSGSLAQVPTVDTLNLKARGLEAAGRVILKAGGGLDRAEFTRVQAGAWLDSAITLVGRGQGVAPAVEILGGWLDVRRMGRSGVGGRSGSGGATSVVPMTVNLDRLRITDTLSILGLRGAFEAHSGGMTGRFAGSVNGKAAITGQMTPLKGRSAFTIRSAEAGAVVAAAGILSKAEDGDLTLKLTPVGADSYDGVLAIKNFWLKDAPALAALLNAASIVGLLEQMSGGGILFSEVEASFRMTPKQVVITQSSAVGASIGLSMDGIYDLEKQQMDMQGVFSPIYAVNAIGSVLTRKGEGLLGFNFTMRGTGDNPRVSINPLSIFTPGMFREIFRRPPPKVSK